MKKILPTLTFVLVFFAFLAVQIAQDISTSHANKSTGVQNKKVYYENIYKKMSFKMGSQKVTLSKVNEPIVIVSFWASWCIPCLKEFPSLVKLNKFYQEKILTIGINTDEENPELKIKKIEKKYNLNFSSIIDTNSKLTEKFMVDNIPFTLTFVHGKLIHFSEETHDFVDEAYLEKIKKALLEKN